MATSGNALGGAGAHQHAGGTRRDFLMLTGSALTAVGGVLALWPLIDSLNPAADVLAEATVDVDLSPIQEGQRLTVSWRGSPVFVAHRTQAEIEAARSVEVDDLPDPQPDEARVKEGQEKWLVVVGVCTHLGCIPLGQQEGSNRGEYGGWFCPCHGSGYDTSGRIRYGPAPENLPVPAYQFLEDRDNVIRIG